MSDLTGFTEELDEELRSLSDEGDHEGDAAQSAPVCQHRIIFSGFCAEYASKPTCFCARFLISPP